MKTALRVLACAAVALLTANLWAAETAKLTVEGRPRWFEITGDGTTSGTDCPIRSVVTGKVVASEKAGFKFLSFGVSEKWITFGYNGSTAFVPLASVKELYPVEAPPMTNRFFGHTLEKSIEEQKKRAEAEQKAGTGFMPSKLKQKLTATPTPAGGAVGGAGFGGKGGRGGAGGSGQAL